MRGEDDEQGEAVDRRVRGFPQGDQHAPHPIAFAMLGSRPLSATQGEGKYGADTILHADVKGYPLLIMANPDSLNP